MSDISHDEQNQILIVDDEPSIRRSLQRLLQMKGFSVEVAADLTAALAAVENQRFDVLLVDVILPGIRGPDLAARLQQVQPDLAVIFMSGYPRHALEDVSETTHQLVGKPFDMDHLFAAIAAVLERR